MSGGDESKSLDDEKKRQRLRDQLMKLNGDRNDLESEIKEYGDILKSVSLWKWNSPATDSMLVVACLFLYVCSFVAWFVFASWLWCGVTVFVSLLSLFPDEILDSAPSLLLIVLFSQFHDFVMDECVSTSTSVPIDMLMIDFPPGRTLFFLIWCHTQHTCSSMWGWKNHSLIQRDIRDLISTSIRSGRLVIESSVSLTDRTKRLILCRYNETHRIPLFPACLHKGSD